MTWSSENPLAKVEQLLEARATQAALRLLTPWVASHPEDVDGMLAFARALLQLGRSREAMDLIEHATSLEPDRAYAWHLLAVASSNSEHHANAIHAAKTARALQPHNATFHAYFVLATVFAGRASKKTVVDAKKAIELDPHSFLGHYVLGKLWMSLDRPRRAERSFHAALGIDPTNSEVLHDLAILQFQQGKIGTSVRGLGDVLAKQPDHELSRRNIRIVADRILFFILLGLWLYIGVLGFANMWSPSPSGGFASSGEGLPYASALTRFLLVLGLTASILGYILWFRVTAGPRFRQIVASMYTRDRLQIVWTSLLGLCFALEIATTLSGAPFSEFFFTCTYLTLFATSGLRGVMTLMGR